MPTFRSKKIVDGRQFDGTEESAKDLSAWFKEHAYGYHSSTLEKSLEYHKLGDPDSVVDVGVPSTLILRTRHLQPLYLKKSDWLIRHDTGSFEVVSDYMRVKDYEQV